MRRLGPNLRVCVCAGVEILGPHWFGRLKWLLVVCVISTNTTQPPAAAAAAQSNTSFSRRCVRLLVAGCRQYILNYLSSWIISSRHPSVQIFSSACCSWWSANNFLMLMLLLLLHLALFTGATQIRLLVGGECYHENSTGGQHTHTHTHSTTNNYFPLVRWRARALASHFSRAPVLKSLCARFLVLAEVRT